MFTIFISIITLIKSKIEEDAFNYINAFREERGYEPMQRIKALDKASKKIVKLSRELGYPNANPADDDLKLENRLPAQGYSNYKLVNEIVGFGAINDCKEIIDSLPLQSAEGEDLLTKYNDIGISTKKDGNRRYWGFIFATTW